MQVNLRVKRYDPERDKDSHWESYQIDLKEDASVLDGLIQVREYVDQTLGVRCSCRAAICGSCAMRVNDEPRLMCNTKVRELMELDGEVAVEPMGNLPVIKDCIVDMAPFWDKIRSVQPWIVPPDQRPEREYLVPNTAMREVVGVMGCIMCGACVSDCNSWTADDRFLGPAALAKAYRFVADPRDNDADRRLGELMGDETGIWACTHCFQCVQACPKGVAPLDRILALRREATEAGYTDNNGTRHSDSFAASVKTSGWLDEARLAIDSPGVFNLRAQLASLPVGIRAILKGKAPLPGPLHHKRPGHGFVKRLFERLEVRR